MNILIPMAGEGKRFKQEGYKDPKPLIPIFGKPMIQTVIESLNLDGNYIFVVQKSHCDEFEIDKKLKQLVNNCKIVKINDLTQGAACTTLLAKEFIDSDESLIIANSDQFVKWNSKQFIESAKDGCIATFVANETKWSYAKLGDDGFVANVAEKIVISNIATVGIYFWKSGKDYVKYAEQMISKNIRTNNEFYVCPVYNEAIQDGKKITTYNIDQMCGLGTPEDLTLFVNSILCDK